MIKHKAGWQGVYQDIGLESLSDVVEMHLNVFHMVEQGNEFILAVLHIIHEMRHAIFHGLDYHVQ